MIQTSTEIRSAYLKFFQERGHQIVPSSSLIPVEDPTLLFTSAGMVQFKKFWATDTPLPYKRATSCQKSLRAGGKDSDLEMVGRSLKHHTFFEMLGNFSFGDYFKKEAITWAYEFVTRVLEIPFARVWVSYYQEDEETRNFWLDYLPEERLVKLGAKDNFWGPAGDTGPCGPCTELYYDFGQEHSCGPGCQPGCDCGRFLEFWNLVFPQYDQQADGKRIPLKRRGVDTGMGLERICRIRQKTSSNYETDLFRPLISVLEKISGQSYQHPEKTVPFRIISDHIRAAVFLVDEGLVPGNEGREYVLRNLIRRAAVSGMELGLNEPFLSLLVPAIVETMGSVYPSIKQHQELICRVLREEEERFQSTSEFSSRRFREYIKQEVLSDRIIPGWLAFKLYGTLGIRRDLLAKLAQEEGLKVDWEGLEKLLSEEKERSRRTSAFGENLEVIFSPAKVSETVFLGYETLTFKSHLIGLFRKKKDNLLQAVTEATAFYPEKGGQLGDQGFLIGAGFRFRVIDTQIDEKGVIYHLGDLKEGKLEVLSPGVELTGEVDKERRLATSANHTATHLLHFALRHLFGPETRQAGSYVGADRLRFDFICSKDLTKEELKQLEQVIQEKIFADTPVKTKELALEEAISQGAVALFLPRYGEKVRTVYTGDYHIEVCGGTHVERTGQIGIFKIIGYTSIGKNLRRIEALTRLSAVNFLNQWLEVLDKSAALLEVPRERVYERLEKMIEQLKEKERQLRQAEDLVIQHTFLKLVKEAEKVQLPGKEISLVVARVKVWQEESLGFLADRVEAELSPAVVVVAAELNQKLFLVIKISKELAEVIAANALIKVLSAVIKGGGGGSKTFAQGRGAKEADWELLKSKTREFVETYGKQI